MISDRIPPRWLAFARRMLVNTGRRRFPEMEPRRWSNTTLRKISPLFTGDVVNVSGWKDQDKQGGTYKTYFTSANRYSITNYWGTSAPDDGIEGSLFLDLTGELPPELEKSHDVAFCHTVLEHVADIEASFRNLARITRDVLIVIVPFMQDEHFSPGLYGDYWRFTPHGLSRLFEINGMTTVSMQYNSNPWYPIYLLGVGAFNPERWKDRMPAPYPESQRAGKEVYNAPGTIWF